MRGAWRTSGVDQRAVGQHDVQTHDEVFDLAVASGILACAAACHPAAHGGQRHRLGPVAHGEVV